jgi:hypothetical protein
MNLPLKNLIFDNIPPRCVRPVEFSKDGGDPFQNRQPSEAILEMSADMFLEKCFSPANRMVIPQAMRETKKD